MQIAKIILAGAAVLAITGSAALAQQEKTGMVTKLDRIHGTVAVQQMPSGTVGGSTGGAVEEFKALDGLSLDTLHAGDSITFSTTETGGVRTITKFEKQKL